MKRKKGLGCRCHGGNENGAGFKRDISPLPGYYIWYLGVPRFCPGSNSVSISGFADNTKLSRAKTSQQDIATLQEDFSKIKGWATTW